MHVLKQIGAGSGAHGRGAARPDGARRRIAHALFYGFTVSLASVAACGGNHDLFVRGVLAPPSLDIHSGDACVYTANASSPLLSSGTVDAALASNYAPTFLLGNTGGDRIAVQSATVRLVDTSGNEIVAFDAPAATSVDPGSNGAPGYASVSFDLVDESTLGGLAGRLEGEGTIGVLAYVEAHGTTSSGGSVDSPELMFRVDVCNGCLVTFPEDATDRTKGTPNCAAPISTSTTGDRPCVVGQDQTADCRLCQSDSVCTP